MQNQCPCTSGKLYEECCKPYHEGKLPDTPVQLMRSRFSAYALNLADYIIKTTHPASSQYGLDLEQWKQGIEGFSEQTEFKKLEILDHKDFEGFSTVTFVATIFQNGEDSSFTERSFFENIGGRWLYRHGQMSSGHMPNLITTEKLNLMPIAYFGDPILRKKTEPIKEITPDIIHLSEMMTESMHLYNGIGISANQVMHSVQMFIMCIPKDVDQRIEFVGSRVVINPKIINESKETWEHPEGCLSIPAVRGRVKRPTEITVEYMNIKGEIVEQTLNGWEARIFLHEYDHLQGVLFTDKVPEEEKKLLKPYLEQLKNRIHQGGEL